MKVLGINSFTHDVAVCLITKKKPLYMIEEERISRIKHHNGIIFQGSPPYKAIELANFYGTPSKFGHSRSIYHSAKISNYPQMRFLEFSKSLDEKLKYTKFCNHHLCHAASAYYPSQFDKAYVFTLDSRGDGLSGTISIGEGNSIRKIYEIPGRSSVCEMYSHITNILGLGYRNEGSLMSLAAFGTNNNLLNGFFEWTGKSLLINDIPRFEQICLTNDSFEHKANVAASLQKSFENIVLTIISDICDDRKIKKLALAGGAFLNCLLNQRIAESGRWENVYVSPVAGDTGTALGAALLCLDEPKGFFIESRFLGG